MTDRLRILHTSADALLATVGTAAVEAAPDDPAVRGMWAEADGLLSRLVVRGLEDLAGRAYPGSAGDGGPVSSSAISDPTGQAGSTGRLSRARDYWTVCRTVEHVVGILTHAPTGLPGDELARASAVQTLTRTLRTVASTLRRCYDRLTPVATGEPCPTVATDSDGNVVARCTGSVTHHGTGRGLCEQCDGDWRPRRGLDVPAEVLEARNARRRHGCTCHEDGHDHPPGGCLGRTDPGVQVGRCEACRCSCGPGCCPDGCTDPRAPGRTRSQRCRIADQRRRRKASTNAK